MPVELAEDDGGLGGEFGAELVAGEFRAARRVRHADVRAAHRAERLPALFGLVDGDREDDPLHALLDRAELDAELFAVGAVAGIAEVGDGAVGAGEVVEEHEVLVGKRFPSAVAQQRVRVQVVVVGGLPAEADQDGRGALAVPEHGNVGALRQGR